MQSPIGLPVNKTDKEKRDNTLNYINDNIRTLPDKHLYVVMKLVDSLNMIKDK